MGFELTILVVICTDCIYSCKSNYHTITTTPCNDSSTSYNDKYTSLFKVVIIRYLRCSIFLLANSCSSELRLKQKAIKLKICWSRSRQRPPCPSSKSELLSPWNSWTHSSSRYSLTTVTHCYQLLIICWSRSRQTPPCSQQKVNWSRHDIAENILHRAIHSRQ